MLSKTESQRCFHNACLYTIHNFKELEFKCFYFQTFSSKLLEFLIVKFSLHKDNLSILYYENLDLETMLQDLYEKFGCQRLTIQPGGTLNAEFLRKGLFDYLDIVAAPVLVGGKDTSSLIDGPSFTSFNELNRLGILTLIKADVLQDSYIRLKYKVENNNAE